MNESFDLEELELAKLLQEATAVEAPVLDGEIPACLASRAAAAAAGARGYPKWAVLSPCLGLLVLATVGFLLPAPPGYIRSLALAAPILNLAASPLAALVLIRRR